MNSLSGRFHLKIKTLCTHSLVNFSRIILYFYDFRFLSSKNTRQTDTKCSAEKKLNNREVRKTTYNGIPQTSASLPLVFVFLLLLTFH